MLCHRYSGFNMFKFHKHNHDLNHDHLLILVWNHLFELTVPFSAMYIYICIKLFAAIFNLLFCRFIGLKSFARGIRLSLGATALYEGPRHAMNCRPSLSIVLFVEEG